MALATLENSLRNRTELNEYYFNICKEAAKRSAMIVSTGACIVKNGRIISVGYNGTPINMKDKQYRSLPPDWQNYLICHAPSNAIVLSETTINKDCVMYITHAPCIECAKAIINSGIKTIYILDLKVVEASSSVATPLDVTAFLFNQIPSDTRYSILEVRNFREEHKKPGLDK